MKVGGIQFFGQNIWSFATCALAIGIHIEMENISRIPKKNSEIFLFSLVMSLTTPNSL
jgi:hypothetical protein